MAREGLLSCADYPTACAVVGWLGEHPLVAAGAAALAIVAMFLAGTRLGVRSDGKSRERFAAFVGALGGRMLPGHDPTGEATVSGHAVRIRAFRTGTRVTHNWTQLSLAVADRGFTLEVRPREALASAGEFLSFGDKPFDERFLVMASDAGKARLALDPQTRRLLCEVGETGRVARRDFHLRVHEGELAFRTPGEIGDADYDRRLRLAMEAGAAIGTNLSGS